MKMALESEAHRSRKKFEEQQVRLHAAAAKTFGSISGGRVRRAENVHRIVRKKLQKRHTS
jgi:hypothetical protein